MSSPGLSISLDGITKGIPPCSSIYNPIATGSRHENMAKKAADLVEDELSPNSPPRSEKNLKHLIQGLEGESFDNLCDYFISGFNQFASLDGLNHLEEGWSAKTPLHQRHLFLQLFHHFRGLEEKKGTKNLLAFDFAIFYYLNPKIKAIYLSHPEIRMPLEESKEQLQNIIAPGSFEGSALALDLVQREIAKVAGSAGGTDAIFREDTVVSWFVSTHARALASGFLDGMKKDLQDLFKKEQNSSLFGSGRELSPKGKKELDLFCSTVLIHLLGIPRNFSELNHFLKGYYQLFRESEFQDRAGPMTGSLIFLRILGQLSIEAGLEAKSYADIEPSAALIAFEMGEMKVSLMPNEINPAARESISKGLIKGYWTLLPSNHQNKKAISLARKASQDFQKSAGKKEEAIQWQLWLGRIIGLFQKLCSPSPAEDPARTNRVYLQDDKDQEGYTLQFLNEHYEVFQVVLDTFSRSEPHAFSEIKA